MSSGVCHGGHQVAVTVCAESEEKKNEVVEHLWGMLYGGGNSQAVKWWR